MWNKTEDVDWLTTRRSSRALLLFPLSCTLVAVPQRERFSKLPSVPAIARLLCFSHRPSSGTSTPPTSPPSNPTFQINSRRFVSSASFDPKITLIGLQWTRNALVVLWLWFRRTIGAELSSDALRVFVPILSCKSLVPCEVYA